MNRRKFCRTAVAASVAATFPGMYGCERGTPVATEANTSIRGISLTGNEIELEKAAVKELGESMRGPILLSGHPEYDGNSLLKEYKREVNRFIAREREDYPPFPENYFDANIFTTFFPRGDTTATLNLSLAKDEVVFRLQEESSAALKVDQI